MLGFNFCELLSSPTDLRGFSSRKFLSNCNDLTFFPKYPAILMVKYKRTISLKTEERKFVLIQRTRSSSVSYCFHGTLILLICGKVKYFFWWRKGNILKINERNSVLIFLVWHRVSGAQFFLFHLYCSINKVTTQKRKYRLFLTFDSQTNIILKCLWFFFLSWCSVSAASMHLFFLIIKSFKSIYMRLIFVFITVCLYYCTEYYFWNKSCFTSLLL